MRLREAGHNLLLLHSPEPVTPEHLMELFGQPVSDIIAALNRAGMLLPSNFTQLEASPALAASLMATARYGLECEANQQVTPAVRARVRRALEL